MNPYLKVLCLLALVSATLSGGEAEEAPGYAAWPNGPSTAPEDFPLAVWLQGVHNVERYKAIGVNLYVGLYNGPTEDQLAALSKARMPVICHQNDVALKSANNKIVVAWMHGDEPDNAQAVPGKGFGPPILPQVIVEDYERLRKTDPSRPILLNLGQGVAWDAWHGRGVRSNKPEDYPAYVKGADIVSFDIYPTSHTHKDIAGNLWYVARGVERLRQWTERKKPVWCCIETTQIDSPGKVPTPHAIRAEVWMALVHGARGIIYFAHEFKPRFIEAGIFAHPEVAAAVKSINAEVKSLAPALNAPTLQAVRVQQEPNAAPVAVLCKKTVEGLYLFAVNLRDTPTQATFQLDGAGVSEASVLNEKRTLPLKQNTFSDSFQGYDVHLYVLK